MARIVFKTQGKEFDVPVGSSIPELSDENKVFYPFTCRAGVCTTCLCNVLEGEDCLSEKEENEKMTLEGASAKENQRLGCQLRIVKEGKIVIESVEP